MLYDRLRRQAEALLEQKDQLWTFLEVKDMPPYNNFAERAMRRVVIGRRNWMFAGSDSGGARAAIIYSLVATCKLHGIDPFEYFQDVLGRLPSHPLNQIQSLLPLNWKVYHSTTNN